MNTDRTPAPTMGPGKGPMGAALSMALVAYIAVVVGLVLLLDPIPQDPAYHQFADQRTVLGITHAGDVLSNLGFLAVGAAGLFFLLRSDDRSGIFSDPTERSPFLVFFAGMLLTGAGSAWYHLDPTNASLVLDRLPMTLTTAGFTAAVVGERLSPRMGRLLLWPLVVVGLLSVFWWSWSEHLGQGDLRPYALFQFGPIAPLVALLVLLPSRYSHGGCYGGAIALYGLAKLAEYFDHSIYAALSVASGHNLKHIFAATVGGCLLWMLYRRRATPRPPATEHRRYAVNGT